MSSEAEDLGWLIKRIQHGHHRALDKGLAHLDVTLVQWNALREIGRNPGASQHQLAERTFNSDQAFGTLLVRLKAAGWIERHPGPGRVTTHQLTHQGMSLLRAGQETMSRVTKKSFAALQKDERQTLARLLEKVFNRSPED